MHVFGSSQAACGCFEHPRSALWGLNPDQQRFPGINPGITDYQPGSLVGFPELRSMLFLVTSHIVQGPTRFGYQHCNVKPSTSYHSTSLTSVHLQRAVSMLSYPNAMVPCYVAQLVFWSLAMHIVNQSWLEHVQLTSTTMTIQASYNDM